MMPPKITLTLNNGQGSERQVAITSNRFSVGRSPNNDLVIDDPGLSRRQVLIESFDGVVQVSDCGSQNGTLVNGRPVTGAVKLKDGDVISMGSECDLTVHINGFGTGSTDSADEIYRQAAGGHEIKPGAGKSSSTSIPYDTGSARKRTMTGRDLSVIAVAAMAITLLASGLIIVVQTRKGPTAPPPAIANQNVQPVFNENKSAAPPFKDDPIKLAAKEVMRCVSTSDSNYVFRADEINDIRRKVEQYRASPTLPRTLNAIQQKRAEVTARAQDKLIKPCLAVYAALAESEDGRADPVTTAYQIMDNLQWLETDWGEDADSILIVIAAFKSGGVKAKKSDPLQARLRGLKPADRNVWDLHKRGVIDAKAYDFVIRFLALGVLAQNPAQFGIRAAPLKF